MATPQSSDAGVVAALESAGNTGIPDAAKLAEAAAAKAVVEADAALAAAAGQADASPAAIAAVKAWQAAPTPELKTAALAAVAADTAAAAAKLAADPAAKAAELETLQAASTAALKASAAAPNDPALKAAYDAAVKAVNDFVAQKPPAPAPSLEPKEKEKEVKLAAPADKTVSETDIQRLELFAKKHSFSQAQADALLEDARQTELGRRAQYQSLQKANLEVIQSDVEMGGTAERVNLTLERARIGAKHLFTAAELLEMEKSGDANKPALVRACLRHYNMALASPSLVNGDPVKKEPKKLDARNPDDLAAVFAEDTAKNKRS